MKNWRINLVLILIVLLSATIIGRLIYVQILNGELFKAWAQGQQNIPNITQGERGEIFFKDGQILATNINEKYAYISPREIEKKEETAKSLSQTLNLIEDSVLEKVKKDNLFEVLKYKITDEEKTALEALNLPGVYVGEEIFRNYPQNTLASQVVGFMGGAGEGQYGIEGYYNDILNAQEKTKNSSSSNETSKGSDIILTLDYNIQSMAEKLLKDASENLEFKSGQIVVINPNSGEIIALANFPAFNPNEYSEVKDMNIFQNVVIQKIFEPGSIFKPITMAGALEEGKITPQTTYVDYGKLKIGGYTIYNYGNRVWGEQTMTGVLEKSINTGAVFAEEQLGNKKFLDYLDKFKVFEKTNIDLQGEIFSENNSFKEGYAINFATAAFGQGIEMTPIQIVRAFSAIANGGKLVKPYIVKEISTDSGKIETQPEVSDSIISSKTASQLTSMLISVVESGYGKAAKIPGYYIAGKTGTAQISWSALDINKSGYSDETWQSFIGYAPAFDPKFLILVKLDNPQAKTAEYSAVPIFHDLAKYIINLWQIPPDH